MFAALAPLLTTLIPFAAKAISNIPLAQHVYKKVSPIIGKILPFAKPMIQPFIK